MYITKKNNVLKKKKTCMNYSLDLSIEICLMEEQENKFFFLDLHWKTANWYEDSPQMRQELIFFKHFARKYPKNSHKHFMTARSRIKLLRQDLPKVT